MVKRTQILLLSLLLGSCTMFADGKGQVVYHWERENTGIQKFSRDHTECLTNAKDFRWMPNIKNWVMSEQETLEVRADWESDKGIWASYVAYPGAQPVVVNSLKSDFDASPRKYRVCMEKKGYWHRTSYLPSLTNINHYNPRGRDYYTPYKLGYQ